MCLAFFGVQVVKPANLVIAFNRDEDFVRPTKALHFWEDCPDILAGRDNLKLGTWGGVTRDGKAAFLTFVRQKKMKITSLRSRGMLVSEFLKRSWSAGEYLEYLEGSKEKFLGYNLIFGTAAGLQHYSNVTGKCTGLTPGVHGVSNALLNTPWPKVVKGKERLEKFSRDEWLSPEKLFSLMMDNQRTEYSEAQREVFDTDENWRRSSIYVRSIDWGTRSTSVIHFFNDGRIRFEERTHDRGGEAIVFELPVSG